MPDAVGQRSSDNSKNAGNRLHSVTDVIKNFFAGALLFSTPWCAEIHIEFGGRDRNHMVAAFRSAKAAADFLDFGHREYLLFDDIRDAVHFIERGSGRRCGGDKRCLLFEGGEEILPHFRVEGERREHGYSKPSQNRPGMLEADPQCGRLQTPFHGSNDPSFLMLDSGPRIEKERAKNRNQSEGYQKRSQHADDGRYGNRRE